VSHVNTFAKFLAKLPKRILELLLVRAKRVAKVLDEKGNLALELKKCEQVSEDAQKSTPCFNRVPKLFCSIPFAFAGIKNLLHNELFFHCATDPSKSEIEILLNIALQ
jgi:hypothetical protein